MAVQPEIPVKNTSVIYSLQRGPAGYGYADIRRPGINRTKWRLEFRAEIHTVVPVVDEGL